MYAGRKRKKPVPKSPKPPPPEGVKSNPSKRHRDRLNQELNKLTGLLPFPEDVCTRLDKLSILRLAVGYLKVKSYLMATAMNVGDRMLDQPRAPGGDGQTDLQVNRELFPEGELLLQALNGFVIAVTGDGYIFYISPTVQDYLGFHQSDLIYQSVYELIHTDDRATFHCQLHGDPVSGSTQHTADALLGDQALPAGCSAASSPQPLCPEKPSFAERSFTCRFRCLLDNSSGFLALNFRGRLKFLLGQQKAPLDESPLALFAIATPLQSLSILELRTKTLIFQTKHKLDFTPMACDSWGKVVLGYTETELCRKGSGYQFVHAADMMYCAENHVRMMKTGESGLTVFRLLTKKGSWVWLQANARLVYKGGKPDCIIARQRALSNEEGEEHLRKRNLQLPFSFATGEAVLYGNDLPEFLDSFQAKEELQTQAKSHSKQHSVDPNSLLGAMMKQDASLYISHADNVPQFLPDLIAEPDGLSQHEEVSDAKEDSDSLLVIFETLFEKSKVDRNICQTLQSLNVDNAELQRWEETLLSLGAGEKPPAQEVGERLGTKVTSCVEQMLLREDAGKSTDFPCCSASPCNEEDSAVARFQHCWAANSVFQAPPQAQAPGAQGQDAAVSLVSITSEVSSAQPDQQVPFNPAGLVGRTVLDVPGSSSKPSVALQLANLGQVLQTEVTTSAPVDNAVPDDQSQPGVRPGPAEGGSSNPSKRHRERLNRELERLAGLLPFPEEVVAGLDKLSVLRLSAGYLRAKSFFSVALKNHGAKEAERDGDRGNGPAPGSAAVLEGELLLQALNGFVLVVTSEGLIFYSSHTIQDYLGFHQTDVMHQSVFELIHTEDQEEFRRNLHWALNPPHAPEDEPSAEGGKSLGSPAVTYKPDQLPPENSSFLERSFVCRFRCLLDNSSGFLALNLQGRLKFLHGQNKRSEDGSALPPQLALFAISTPLQPPSILQIRTKNMIFRTKHKLDFTPLACDAKGKIVLGYTEAELRMRGTGYQFVHAADMLYCAENHVRMMKTGESGLTVFRLLTKENRWKWVQANARLVYKNGKPEYIVVTQRPLVDEEGGEHLRKRSMHLPFTFATGEALLYQSAYPLSGFPDPFQSKGKTSKSKKTSRSHGGRSQKNGVDPSSLLGAVMRQDKAVYASHPAPAPNHSFSSSSLGHLEDVSLLDAGRDAWSMGTAPVSSRGNSLKEELVDLQQEDPLLATLDSLSIKSDESCSNNEFFSVLEGLGLNAEDLELLLLDEKMVMVNMDPDRAPSLNDCLASNEVLSYIHTTLVNKHEGGQQLIPEKQPSPVPSVPQHPFPSSAGGRFGSIGSPMETPVSSFGTYASVLSQESRHRPESGCVLPSSAMGVPGDPAPPCQPHPRAEALPDHPRASSGDFCL
ncbi:aryl hydrocarbon receptor-like [Grus japonensis]|uniref:Aryl hydrocarbon receptor n=1 Tax=Grus japonensis TaxID=30415 RepID=A0ABC9X379_GRUJA